MKLMTKAALALCLALAGTMAGDTAFARHGGVSWGLSFGFPGYWYNPAPYYYPPYYPPAYPYSYSYDPYSYPSYPGYGYPAEPMTYIERGAQPAPAQPQAQWWYYCAESRAYYPYVKECAGAWQRVSPTPPGS